jgi:hypothetical protein
MLFISKLLGAIVPWDCRDQRVEQGLKALLMGTSFFLLQMNCAQAQLASPPTQPPGSPPLSHPLASRNACRFLTPVPGTHDSAMSLSATEAAIAMGNTPALGSPRAQEIKKKDDDEFGLKLPTREQLFRLQSEQAFLERLRKELPEAKNVQFPKDVPFVPEVPQEKLVPFPRQSVAPVSGQVCYRPLYFEDKKTERFGEYVPCLQPLVSTTRFYVGVLMLPWRLYVKPPWVFECDNR